MEPKELIFKRRGDAQNVLDHMKGLCQGESQVSVAVLYNISSIGTMYGDDRWGWDANELSRASISKVSNGYILTLPKPREIY